MLNVKFCSCTICFLGFLLELQNVTGVLCKETELVILYLNFPSLESALHMQAVFFLL